MLVFLIPLKSKQVSKDWIHVTRLLERCILSILHQTSDKFKLIIVCHERPDITIEHPAISYLEVDFPPPVLGQANIIGQMDRDKNQKMLLGVEYANQFNPSHVMFVDADDCVSYRIAEFVNQHPDMNGWFFDAGYVYEDGQDRIYYKRNNFYLMSGTSHIINYALVRNMTSIYIDSGEPLHQLVVDILASKKTPLEPFPFAGAVYIVQTGENINADQGADRSGREDVFASIKNMILKYPRKFRTLIGSQKLSEQLIYEFGLNIQV